MLTREKFVPYLQMIAEIQHISGPTWSEHDVMSLIKTQNDFVNNPLACPIARAKKGVTSPRHSPPYKALLLPAS